MCGWGEVTRLRESPHWVCESFRAVYRPSFSPGSGYNHTHESEQESSFLNAQPSTSMPTSSQHQWKVLPSYLHLPRTRGTTEGPINNTSFCCSQLKPWPPGDWGPLNAPLSVHPGPHGIHPQSGLPGPNLPSWLSSNRPAPTTITAAPFVH